MGALTIPFLELIDGSQKLGLDATRDRLALARRRFPRRSDTINPRCGDLVAPESDRRRTVTITLNRRTMIAGAAGLAGTMPIEDGVSRLPALGMGKGGEVQRVTLVSDAAPLTIRWATGGLEVRLPAARRDEIGIALVIRGTGLTARVGTA